MCNSEDMEYQETIVVMGLLLMVVNYKPIESCRGPRFYYGRKNPIRELPPLVLKQHIPNISEITVGASGPPEGRISRGDKRFRDLVPNYNPDIVFKNEETSDADRWMTKRCKDRLNLLATLVQNHWPNVKLRVTEAWDEDNDHLEGSLHYEGRAVDVTTDDRDHSKYGVLARLAVEAGFDWVFYESKHHVHASVMADDSPGSDELGGCFPADSTVKMENGDLRVMSQLKVGDRILTVDRNSGETKATDVILLMHKDENVVADFLTITATSQNGPKSVTLTPNHLLFIHEEDNARPGRWRPRAAFAEDVSIGDNVYIKTFENNATTELPLLTVTSITPVKKRGVYAPLTEEGTLVVDGVVASSYAVFDNEPLSHSLFLPLRLLWRWGFRWGEIPECGKLYSGVHWYPASIFKIASALLPSGVLNS